jgi:cytidylate kinase
MIGLISLLKEIQGKPKAIFMAEPAGSGKSYIAKQLIPSNFKTINVDDTYEELLKTSGIGMKLAQMSPEELQKAAQLMAQARKTTDQKYKQLTSQLNNILIDSVGGSANVIAKKKQELENLGYDTAMLMTYVSPITSLERNKQRDRSLLPSIVLRSWRDVNTNINAYKQMFEDNFVLVNNEINPKTQEFDPNYIYQTFIKPLGQVGKEKSPYEKTKSKQETQQLYSDIQLALQNQPEFDTLQQAKSKINKFINL